MQNPLQGNQTSVGSLHEILRRWSFVPLYEAHQQGTAWWQQLPTNRNQTLQHQGMPNPVPNQLAYSPAYSQTDIRSNFQAN